MSSNTPAKKAPAKRAPAKKAAAAPPTRIEARRTVVTLYGGEQERELQDLLDRIAEAVRREAVGPRRMSTKSEAARLAAEYDEKRAAAPDSGVDVPLWAISYLQWGPLADQHPPREGVEYDQARQVNTQTFPRPLMLASLVEPEAAKGMDIDERVTAGELVLADLGELDIVHIRKLEKGAWDVNVGDDALPKSSLVSLLQDLRGHDSKPQPDSEPVPRPSRGGRASRRTSTTT